MPPNTLDAIISAGLSVPQACRVKDPVLPDFMGIDSTHLARVVEKADFGHCIEVMWDLIFSSSRIRK